MEFLKKTAKYLVIVLIGIILAFFVARIQYSNTDLSASILSLTEQDFFESTSRDAGYKKENQIFEIFLSEQTRDDGDLTISLISSPSNFTRITDEITSPYGVEIVSQNTGNIILNVTGYSLGDFSEGILQIPFIGDSQDATLEYITSTKRKFAIGSLDNIPSDFAH